MNDARQINIVYLVPSLSRTGPTRQLLNLIRNLDMRRFKPLLVTLSPPDNSGLLQEFERLSIDIQSLNVSRKGTLFQGLRRLHALLSTSNVDLIHSQGLRADLLSSLLPRRYTRIATRRNKPHEDYRYLHGRIFGAILANLHLMSLKRLDTVVVCAKSLLQQKRKALASHVVIPNGTDLRATSSDFSGTTTLAIRRDLDLPTDKRIFVFSGPLISRKNIALLISTFLERQRTADMLIVVGDGPEMSNLYSCSSRAPNVVFPGMVADVGPYLRSADCFISASRAEGMPNSVLEALAHGLPVLLSNIPAHKEILDIAGDVGWLFSLKLENSLNALLNSIDLPARNRSSVRSTAKRFFSAEAMSRSYQDLYVETIFH